MPQDADSIVSAVVEDVYTTGIANDWLRFLADVVPTHAPPPPQTGGKDVIPLHQKAVRIFARTADHDRHRLHAQEHPYNRVQIETSAGMVLLLDACRKKNTCLKVTSDMEGNLHARFDPEKRFEQSSIFGQSPADITLKVIQRRGNVLSV